MPQKSKLTGKTKKQHENIPEMAGPSSLGLLVVLLECLGIPGGVWLLATRCDARPPPSGEALLLKERLLSDSDASVACAWGAAAAPCSLSMAASTSRCVLGSSSPSRCRDCRAAIRCSCTVSFWTCHSVQTLW